MKKVSVIMPALNEEKNILDAIEDTLGAFERLKIDGEIVVINDGSTDRTGELVKQAMAKDDRLHLVVHEKPHGFGASFWDGVDHAAGEAVVCLPGDNENIAFEILRYAGLLNSVDIVIPFVYNKEARPAFRNFLSFVYRCIINFTFATNLNYTNGNVIYSKRLLDKLQFCSSGFFFQTDALIRLVKQGYLFAEVPQRIKVRIGGESKAVSFPSLKQVVLGYFRLCRDLYYLRNHKIDLDEVSVSAQRKMGEADTNSKVAAKKVE